MAKLRPCVQCGATFLPEFPGGARRTCSDECAKERRRANSNKNSKIYYRRNLKVRRAKALEWVKKNPERKRAAWNDWAQRNRKRRNAQKRAQYAKNRKVIGTRRKWMREARNAERKRP